MNPYVADPDFVLYVGDVREVLKTLPDESVHWCGSTAQPHLHHVKPWAVHPDLRFDPENVIRLCRSCHHDAHRKEVCHQ